jgi:[protein-PII] uridylyltransferase
MTDLNIKIEELISNNADDFQISKVIKLSIKEYLNSLDAIFETNQGKDFFIKHTKKIDGFIKILYKYLLRKHFGPYQPMSNSIPITLIALGSYGREQLCVYSDIDIMVLYQEIPGYNLKPIMEEFMILAWDSGLKLGSRVHEINEIEDSVKTDITIKTSILESRLIYGSKQLWFHFQNRLQNIRHHNQKEFIIEKIQEHKKRLLENPLDMQANIKDGYGGMRESNMVFWMSTIIYGVGNTRDLMGKVFSESRYKEYRSALEYIFRIRNALHLIAKKKQDIVIFDLMPELASKLGFVNSPNLTKERQCISKLLNSLHIVHKFASVIIQKLIRPYIFEKKNIAIFRQNRISKNLYSCNNTIYTSYNRKAITLLQALKEINKLPSNIKKFDNSYLNLIQKIDKTSKLSETETKYIVSLLKKENLYPILKLFYNANLFGIIVPYSQRIINQPQFDGYHRHPVDIHTLNAIHMLNNISDKFVLDIFNSLTTQEKDILNHAVLFHDIGKGRSADHHVLGESIFKKFAKSVKLDPIQTQLISKLIRYHNMMNKVATTEDIYSQDVILHFTGLLETPQTLKLLYILTYADINAVKSSIYKSNTSSLLRELYIQCIPAFENKELVKVSSRRFAKENTIKKSKDFSTLPRSLQKKTLSIESNQLFLKYKASSIINIAKIANETETMNYKLTHGENNFTISIIRNIPLNLGFLLAKLGFLDIKSTGIYKLFNNKKFFEIQFNQTVDQSDVPYIQEIIESSFDMSKTIKIKKPIIKRNEIIIDCNHTDALAEIKVSTLEQKGLFSYIAYVFDKFNVEIHSAKIHSTKTKATDLFLIEKNDNFCPKMEDIVNELTT